MHSNRRHNRRCHTGHVAQQGQARVYITPGVGMRQRRGSLYYLSYVYFVAETAVSEIPPQSLLTTVSACLVLSNQEHRLPLRERKNVGAENMGQPIQSHLCLNLRVSAGKRTYDYSSKQTTADACIP